MISSFFFFNDTATTEIYTLSLHDALPISRTGAAVNVRTRTGGSWLLLGLMAAGAGCGKGKADPRAAGGAGGPPGMPVEAAVARTDTVRDEIAATGQIERSEEHTSELQSRLHLVCRLLL